MSGTFTVVLKDGDPFDEAAISDQLRMRYQTSEYTTRYKVHWSSNLLSTIVARSLWKAASVSMKEGQDELRENVAWWHRRWARKRQSAVRSDASRQDDAPQCCHKRRAASQEYDEHVCKSMARCSSSGTQMVVAEVVPRSRAPRSVGSSPLFIRRPLRVLGCASTPSTLDSDYHLAEAHTDETPVRPAKKQRLWRNIKLTTSSIRMGGKSEVANETLSSSAPELTRTSKQPTKQDQQKQTSVDEKVTPKIDEYVTFLVKIRLKDGKNLAVRDASGSSDPYVKFKYKNRTYFKSNTIYKNLNPVWEEEFSQLIDDPTTPIAVDVYDYDRFAADDYMGGGLVDLSQLRLFQPTEMKVKLKEEGTDEMGEINLVVTVTPLTQTEKEQFMKKCVKGITSEQLKRPQKATQIWQSVVNIVLVEGRNLYSPINSTSLPDPFVKFKLGSEKYKSKPASRTRNPKWLEQFDLHMYDVPTHILEVMVNDKRTNSCMGTTSVDLNKLDKESANQLLSDLENGSGSILLLISISGTTSTDAVVDLCEFTGNDVRNAIVNKYNILRTFQRLNDVGYLTVKVFQARNLIAADMGGKSDPFAVVELVNARLQTHTEYKTLNPVWNKLFTFSVKDIHAVLEITVYDEDPNKKAEFLGKVAIPLLKIKNCEKRWYALKDRKLDQPARGQVQVELDVIWNPIRAAVRTFNPREGKYMHAEPKFKRQVFMHNYSRLKNSLLYAIEAHDYVQSCFNWNSPRRSITAFMIYLLWVYFFELYHIPLCILALFLRAHIVKYYNTSGVDITQGETSPREADEDDDISQQDSGANKQLKRQTTERQQSKDSERSSTTLKDRLSAIQDTLAMVQNTMDFIASLLERIKNTFNFTQPYLSVLAIVVLTIATILLYIIPIRWILIAWGINKFTKKLRNPNFIPNNELLDFLSRVPSDAEIKAYEEVEVDERLLTQSSVECSTTQRAAS